MADWRNCSFVGGAALAAALLALPAFGVLAQDAAPPPAQPQATPPPAATPAQPPANRPGLIHQLGDWWEQATGAIDQKIKDLGGTAGDLKKKSDEAAKDGAATATDSVKGAAATAGDALTGAFEATKNAATSIVKLPNTRVVDMHETCAKAPNGASDCADAAANSCRGKGFSGGKVLEVRTAEKCHLAALQGGRLPSRGDCGVETTVIRAVCQ